MAPGKKKNPMVMHWLSLKFCPLMSMKAHGCCRLLSWTLLWSPHKGGVKNPQFLWLPQETTQLVLSCSDSEEPRGREVQSVSLLTQTSCQKLSKWCKWAISKAGSLRTLRCTARSFPFLPPLALFSKGRQSLQGGNFEVCAQMVNLHEPSFHSDS